MSNVSGDSVPAVHVGGIPFKAISPSEAAQHLVRAATSSARNGSHIHLANAYSVALANDDPQLMAVFRESSATNIPDGRPISLFTKIRRMHPSLTQVRGPQLFEDVFAASENTDVAHFLLGGKPETLAKLQKALSSRYPNAAIVGSYSPPFRPLSDSERSEQYRMIASTGANMVWVGLGTPKQDYEVLELARSLPVVAVAIGAAFDFSAGTLAVAPSWVHRAGLEWLFRFASEPRRLWKRYTIGNIKFLLALFRNGNK